VRPSGRGVEPHPPVSLPSDLARVLGASAPSGADLVRFGERAYARFSRDFERAATQKSCAKIRRRPVVLANDISEGPDFETLAARGYRVFTIYHVDVVGYVRRDVFPRMDSSGTTVRWYPRLRALLPDMARFGLGEAGGQRALFARADHASEGMREVLLRCYPFCPPERVHVLPWGAWESGPPGDAAPLRQEFGVPKTLACC